MIYINVSLLIIRLCMIYINGSLLIIRLCMIYINGSLLIIRLCMIYINGSLLIFCQNSFFALCTVASMFNVQCLYESRLWLFHFCGRFSTK